MTFRRKLAWQKSLLKPALRNSKPIRGKRRVIRDGASMALFLIVQSSGHKSWMMRFRYGAGATKIFSVRSTYPVAVPTANL